MKNVIAVGALMMVAGTALAKDLPSLSTSYIPAPESIGVDTLTASEGFEGFGLGPISGQGGWTTFLANQNAPVVSNLTPAGGSQHLRITQGPGSAGGFNGAFSPDYGDFANKKSIVSVDVRVDTPGGADAIVIAQAPSQGFLTWRVQFRFTGNIFILDDLGAGLALVDTGVPFVQGAYSNLTVVTDAAAGTIDYFYGGNPLYSSNAGVFAATAVEQVILAGDNFYNNAEESISYDNFSIAVPTPGALALFGLGGLAAARRRR
ncbi:MAG: PEP-CTERM sorting domain-containing protein [Phycisphaerales bacterium]